MSTSPPGRASTSVAGRDPRRPWAPSPFARLARAHAGSVSGDALFAIGLAGSVFFDLDFNSARWRVALYLILTIAPFAVAAPLIGPAIDRIRGGRRWIIVGSLAARAVLAFFVVRHMGSVLFYPEAFGMLVLQKVYSISKSAVVPGTVRSDQELVEANSKLTVLSAVAVVIVAAPGGILLAVGGGGWSVALGGVVYAVGTYFALRLPPTAVASTPAGPAEKEELRSAGILLAASAMGLIRGIVGFLAFMLAFDFKNNGSPLWHLGLVAATAQLGFFFGAVAAPRLRRLAPEERILVGALAVTTVAGLVTAVIGGLLGAALLSMVVGATGSASKQSFDAIVQRDAPDANRGRSFAKFETRFQLVWVIGALVPIIVPIPAAAGFALIAAVAAFAAVSYLIGQRGIRQGRMPRRRSPEVVARLRARRRRRTDRSPRPTDDAVVADVAVGRPEVADVDPTPSSPTSSAAAAAPAAGPDPTVVADGSDPTVVAAGSDPTVVADGPSSAPAPEGPDPARRWMRRSAEARVSQGAPDDDPRLPFGEDLTVVEEPAEADQPVLFDPDAWDDPLPPEDELPPFA